MSVSPWIATPRLRRISLARINDVVSAHLGPTRVPGNAQPAAFNRQIAMYLAKTRQWLEHYRDWAFLQRSPSRRYARAVLRLIVYSRTSELSFSAKRAC